MKRRHPLPAEVYALVEQTPATVLLEGGKPDAAESNEEPRNEPWTRLFTAPLRVCAAWQAAEIPGLFAEIESAVAAGLCAAGFFSYECGNCFEPKARMRASRAGQPLAWFGIYERSYAFDHETGTFADGQPPELARFRNTPPPVSEPGSGSSRKTQSERSLVSGHELTGAATGAKEEGALEAAEEPQFPGGIGGRRSSGAEALDGSVGLMRGLKPPPPSVRSFSASCLAPEERIGAEFALTEAEYHQRIAAIHELIRAGDVYQLNFTAPFRLEAHGNVAPLYARLRARQPVDYGAFLHWQQGRHILSFSPELFFEIGAKGTPNGPTNASVRRIVTRPMKGTARRGRTTREDREIAEWLRNDAKNRSENVMIVDLLRNDLGRVAQIGSVRAERLFEVERYPTLWQMTSEVSAELRPDACFHEIFRALFPSGSVTGAPKVRAMQLLGELEGAPRGVYTGAIGFFSPRQTVFNVAIRTLELEGGHGTMGAGSGIVIDSDAAGEYRECLLKGEFLTRDPGCRPEHFSLIETLLWDGGNPLGNYPFLGLHLDRLTDSAEYFDFACDRESVRADLERQARHFDDGPEHLPRRVRLLLDSVGSFKVTSEILRPRGDSNRVARVRIAPQRTDPADPMLYHKTTHRPLYAQAFEQATREGFDDVLFLNVRGEVTEGAISNVLMEKDGRWFTPPVDCGLLAGVYRRHLLATRPEIRERVLYLNDLRQADGVYLANAVRGLRRAIVAW